MSGSSAVNTGVGKSFRCQSLVQVSCFNAVFVKDRKKPCGAFPVVSD